MTGWEMGFTRNCARNLNLTTLSTNTCYQTAMCNKTCSKILICTNQNLSKRMTRIKFCRSLRYKKRTRPSDNFKKRKKKKERKRTCLTVDFAVLAEYRLKIKGNEKRDKDFARELKKRYYL